MAVLSRPGKKKKIEIEDIEKLVQKFHCFSKRVLDKIIFKL